MDRKQINEELGIFKAEAAKRNYPLRNVCLVDAFEGLDNYYNIEVYADWIFEQDLSCSEALDILLDIMYDTMSEDSRRLIFIIKILDKNDKVHCVSEENAVENVVFA
jgi:hypothetical protein